MFLISLTFILISYLVKLTRILRKLVRLGLLRLINLSKYLINMKRPRIFRYDD